MIKISWIKGTVRGTYVVEAEHAHAMVIELQIDGAIIERSVPVK